MPVTFVVSADDGEEWSESEVESYSDDYTDFDTGSDSEVRISMPASVLAVRAYPMARIHE